MNSNPVEFGRHQGGFGTIRGLVGDSDESAIRYALETASRHGFRTVRIKHGELRFRAEIGGSGPPHQFALQEGSPELEVIEPQSKPFNVIEAGMVGYFQFSGGPIEAGSVIQNGDIIGSITALGIVNDVVSSLSGEVTDVLVGEGDAVEYGQALLQVEVGE